MFKRIGLFITLVFVSLTIFAQKVSDKKVIRQLRADIGYLASDELKGRRTGSAGEKKAADYIINYYQQNGIPAYNNKYRYPFKFLAGRSIDEHTLIKVDNKVLKEEYCFPLAFSGNGNLHDEVMPDIMEQGKIWMVSFYEDEEQAKDPHFNWEEAAYERCEKAVKSGARGVLFYDKFDAKYPPVFNKRTEFKTLSIPVAFVTNKGYEKYVNPEHIEGLPSVIVDMNVRIQENELKGNNIVSYIDNNAPYTVILGAHYDHLGIGQDGNSRNTDKHDVIHNGADDNASGTAALMQLASWIKDNRLRNYNYMFIHFSAEELGLIGSKRIVEELGLDSSKVAYMMNMDMVGRLNDSTHALTVGGIGTSPAWTQTVDLNDGNFKIVVDSSGVGPSDHTSFYHKGIPVLFFFTGTHTDYHKPTDDADKVNYEGEAMIMKYMYGIIERMEAQPKPLFTKTKQKKMGRARFKVTLGIMPDYSYQSGGVRVDGVTDGRPAYKSGIKAGDIIIKLGEHEIRGMQSYMEALAVFEEGETTEVMLKRDGKLITTPLTFEPK